MAAKRTLRRAAWFLPVQLLLLVGLLELSALLVRPLLVDDTLPDRDSAAEDRPEAHEATVHPYLGFVRKRVEGEPTNEFGFVGPTPLVKRRPDRVNVALLGGSVALHLYRNAGEALRLLLERSDAFEDKDVHLVSLALPGYKQPQQLLALSYLLYRGARYDVVVNLDGFNEVVLPMTDNLPYGTSLHLPRRWWLYERTTMSVDEARQIAAIADLREEQSRLRETFSSTPLRWSGFAQLVGDVLDQRVRAEIHQRDAHYRRMALEHEAPDVDTTFGGSGAEMEEYFLEAGRSWARASLQMHKLATANGFDYVHFLQPNQYVPGSKPLSARELEIAHVDGYDGTDLPYHPSVAAYKPAVEAGYPILQSTGQQLQARGVDFVDLTGMFETTTETLYDDACCHLNREGYVRLARRIAAHITAR